jgi:hypothetical protein
LKTRCAQSRGSVCFVRRPKFAAKTARKENSKGRFGSGLDFRGLN